MTIASSTSCRPEAWRYDAVMSASSYAGNDQVAPHGTTNATVATSPPSIASSNSRIRSLSAGPRNVRAPGMAACGTAPQAMRSAS